MATPYRTQTGAPHKRSLPCLSCRTLRKRCSLEQPTCSRCDKKRVICEYPVRTPPLSIPAPIRRNNPPKEDSRTNNVMAIDNLLQKPMEAETAPTFHRQSAFVSLTGLCAAASEHSPTSEQYMDSRQIACTEKGKKKPCKRCSAQKKRCDSVLPSCSLCSARNLHCDYGDAT
ncbi:hypothetical protein BJ741DRAFT_614948, partial [Chytriomyces cf. hyalinus JEL632]